MLALGLYIPRRNLCPLHDCVSLYHLLDFLLYTRLYLLDKPLSSWLISKPFNPNNPIPSTKLKIIQISKKKTAPLSPIPTTHIQTFLSILYPIHICSFYIYFENVLLEYRTVSISIWSIELLLNEKLIPLQNSMKAISIHSIRFSVYPKKNKKI